jgi:hypothetical protein
MNLFGKILIMLNLLMSLVFMGFAIAVYSTHKNWKEVIMLDKADLQKPENAGKPLGLVHQLSALKAERQTLEEKYLALQKEIKQELAMRNARLQVLETERVNLLKAVDDKAKEIEAVTQDKNVTSAAIAALTAEAGKKAAEIEALSTQIDTIRSQEKTTFDGLLKATDDLAKAQAALDKANSQTKILIAENASMKQALTDLGYNPAVASRIGKPPPKIDGRIRAATPDGLVEVSLGSDDGLMRGHTMEVYREGATPNATKYLGRIEILSTKADVSVGKVIPQYRRGNIEKDDRVATRLN